MGSGPVDLAELTRRGLVRPASATRRAPTIDQMLPVEPLLAPLLRHPGLVPGDVCSVAPRPGGRSLMLALVAAAARAGAWVAAVGLDIGLVLPAVAMGVDPAKMPFISHPGADPLAIVDIVASGCAVVLAAGLGPVPAVRARRLVQRCRDYGAVLVVHGHWPQPTASLRTEALAGHGLGQGRGRLRSRTLRIISTVRGDPRPRQITVLLPDPAGRIAAAPAEPVRRLDPALAVAEMTG